jgi:hypothetical protein
VVVTVEGTPVHGKAASFAGGRRNVGLGRSASFLSGFLPGRGRTVDSECPEGAEEGNVVGVRHEAYAPGARANVPFAARGRVLRSVL